MSVLKIGAVVVLVAAAGLATATWHARRTQALRLINAALAVDAVLDNWHADRAAIVEEMPSAHYRTAASTSRAANRLRRATEASLTALDRTVARLRRFDASGLFTASVGAARDRYLRYTEAWSNYLTQVSEDPVAGLDAPPPIAGGARAARALASTLPPFAGNELRQRVTTQLTP